MKTKRYYFWFSLIIALFYWFHPQSSFSYTYLKPDGVTTIDINRTINVVMIGFEPGSGPTEINQTSLSNKLEPVFISPIYDAEGSGLINNLGGNALKANMSYNFVYADSAYEDYFFGTLLNMAIGAYGPQYGSPQLYTSTYEFAPPPGFNCLPPYYPKNDGSGNCVLASVIGGGSIPLGITPFQFIYSIGNLGVNSHH